MEKNYVLNHVLSSLNYSPCWGPSRDPSPSLNLAREALTRTSDSGFKVPELLQFPKPNIPGCRV